MQSLQNVCEQVAVTVGSRNGALHMTGMSKIALLNVGICAQEGLTDTHSISEMKE